MISNFVRIKPVHVGELAEIVTLSNDVRSQFLRHVGSPIEPFVSTRRRLRVVHLSNIGEVNLAVLRQFDFGFAVFV